MGCGNSRHKTCHDKSCQRYYNNTNQALALATPLQLTIAGSRVVDTGISIETQPQSYSTVKSGLYHISADVTLNAATVGTVTLQVYMDGVALPCTKKTVTVIDGYNPIHTETDLLLEGCCCDVYHTFTFMLTSDATASGTVTELCTGMLKLA